MNSPDYEMVRNCLMGDENAWEDLVRSNKRRIHSMGYHSTRCRAEADDLTQDVFLRAYQTLGSFRADTGSLSGWLAQIARNLLIDRYRKARRNVPRDAIREAGVCSDDSQVPNPLQCLARSETETMVRAALLKLPPGNRSVIVLHDLVGLALQEVAAMLRIPLGTVKSRMIRGRRELARTLRTPFDGHPGPVRFESERAHESLESLEQIVSRESRAAS